MNNYDDLFTANGEKKESKTERPFDKDEWVAKKQQERTEAFEMLDAATERQSLIPKPSATICSSKVDSENTLSAMPCSFRIRITKQPILPTLKHGKKKACSSKKASVPLPCSNPAMSLPARTVQPAFLSM